MARPLSNDLRERVVVAVREGASRRTVAARFGAAVPSVAKWSERARRTGSVAPGKMGEPRRLILSPPREAMPGHLAEKPETRLMEMRGLFLAERGLRASLETIWRFLRAERQSYEKRPAGERGRAA